MPHSLACPRGCMRWIAVYEQRNNVNMLISAHCGKMCTFILQHDLWGITLIKTYKQINLHSDLVHHLRML